MANSDAIYNIRSYMTNVSPGIDQFYSSPVTPSLYDLPRILSPLSVSWETREDAIKKIAQCLTYLTFTYRVDNLFQEIASALITFVQKERELEERQRETAEAKVMTEEVSSSRTLDFEGFENSESAPK